MAEDITTLIPADILNKYVVRSYRYAATILSHGCKPEFDEIIEMLRSLQITVADILTPGGNESRIPKYISAALRPGG